MLKLFLLRHSQTEGNKKKRYIGVTDEPLCQEGIDLLKRAVYPRAQAVFVSPMRRCVQTAGILYPDCGLHIIEELRECDFGEFENKSYLELSDNENYQRWVDSGGMLPFPKGESREEFQRRTLRGFQGAVACCMKNHWEEAALVIHGGSIMNILEAYGIPQKEFYQWQVDNGCGYQVEVDYYLWKKGKRSLHVIDRLPIQ